MADTWKWTPDSKLCFVTTGATAPFTELIESVLSPSCLGTLRESGFTHLLVQYGSAKDVYEQFSTLARAYIQETQSKGEFIIEGIDFNPDGLQAQFQLVQRSKGLVISHAGIIAHTPRTWLSTNGAQARARSSKHSATRSHLSSCPTLDYSTITKRSSQPQWNVTTISSAATSRTSVLLYRQCHQLTNS